MLQIDNLTLLTGKIILDNVREHSCRYLKPVVSQGLKVLSMPYTTLVVTCANSVKQLTIEHTLTSVLNIAINLKL